MLLPKTIRSSLPVTHVFPSISPYTITSLFTAIFARLLNEHYLSMDPSSVILFYFKPTNTIYFTVIHANISY